MVQPDGAKAPAPVRGKPIVTELGGTSLNCEANVVSAENMVKVVCRELGSPQTEIERTVTALSDLIRGIPDKAERAAIAIGFFQASASISIALVVRTNVDLIDVDQARRLFDEVQCDETATGDRKVTLTKAIEHSYAKPMQEFVRTTREKLAELAQADLILESERKDNELEKHIVEIKERAATEKELIGQAAIAQKLAKAYKDLEQAHQREQELATKDVVTGLPNRLFFRDRLAQALSYAERYGQLVAVLFIDIDHFKMVNDTMGHAAGDEVLRMIARRLEKCVRKSDTVARIGGDEFTVILLNVNEAEITVRIAARILQYVSQPYVVSGRDFFLSASIGIAVYPADGNDAELLVRNADTAMYEVKKSGRNGYHFYTQEMSEKAIARLDLENDLRKAIQDNRLELHYQPKVDTYDGKIVGAEALLRWRHAEKGLISPEYFIPLAEEAGIIVEVCEWVLTTACRQARAWQQPGLPSIPIAVNLSMRQFEHGQLVEAIMEILVASNLDTCWLEIELTEGAIRQNADYAKSVLGRLRELGVKIAIDDFGTGYSSLSQLRLLPIDSLKIDRSFILGTPENHDDSILVEAIVALGRKLELTLVAEGVETVEQLHFLREIGCHQYQGYLFSKPLPATAFEAFIAKRSSPIDGAHASATLQRNV